MWAATIYLGISMFSPTEQKVYIGLLESLTIYSGLMFAAIISASCDFIKERQFLKLKDEINNQEVTVYRGAYGTCTSIPVRELVVGDIVDINQGDRVPADCILVEEMNVTVDECMYYKNSETNHTPKETSKFYGYEQDEFDNHKNHPDPFLLSDSKVMTGQGKAIVCAVGYNTLLARNRKKEDLTINEEHTFLEEKLEKTAKQISKYAVLIMALSILTHGIHTFLQLFIAGKSLFSNDTLQEIAKIGIVAIVILMVAIPEGLPLAVSIAMALSINNLKKDKILIKNIESVQTCAMLHDICVGKTGTLTEAKMSVAKYQICDQIQTFENDSENDPDYFNTRLEIHEDMKTIIRECIISNTDVRIETNDVEVKYEPKGQAIEVGLVQFMIENEEDVPNMFIQRNQGAVKVLQLPFDQNYKRKVVVRHVEGDSELVRVYVKGAPEYVIPICTQTLDYQVQPIEFTENHYGSILGHVVSNEMAASGLKVLSYAFKELRIGDLEALMQTYNPESEEFRNELESDLIYVCTFGLNDPLRLNVEDAIQSIRYGAQEVGMNEPSQVNIRILTGDHIETAKFVAMKAGLINESDREVAGIAMTGEIFQGAIGGYEKVWDRIHEEFRVDFSQPKMF